MFHTYFHFTLITVILTGLLSDMGYARAVAHSAVTPVARSEAATWMERFEQHKRALDQLVSAGQPHVVFLGDSITESWQWEGSRVWDTQFGLPDHLALGLGGDRTEHLIWRLQNGYLDRLVKFPPQVIVLLIGTNNVWVNTEREIADGILRIVDLLRERLPQSRLVVTGILPYGAEPNKWRDRNDAANRIVALQLKTRKGTDWLELNSQFLDDRGHMQTYLTTDFLHLSHEGYALWAEELKKHIATSSNTLDDKREEN
jgi:lysophospholipase L1-like esterase